MNILAVNPWIVDCAAYDFWLKPYGFLVLLSYLKNKGVHIDYIDCLEKKITKDPFGRGKIYCENIKKPEILKKIPRYFKRYGIKKEEFENQLKDKNPDYILITSSMTYWYPAIIEAARRLKKKFNAAPIILGGTYANLLYEHAQCSTPCDIVVKNKEIRKLFTLLNINFDYGEFYRTLPAYEDFYKNLDYVVLRTSWGCPFNCSYCAIKELFPDFFRISYKKIVKFIVQYAQKGIKDFVLYDEAFLCEADYAKRLLTELGRLNLAIRFHTPNALHLRYLDKEIAYLLKKCGFVNPHFGLETLNPVLQKLWGDKVNKKDLIRGIKNLKSGGFRDGEFSVYLLLGYPGQNLEELMQEAEFLHSQGAKVSLSEFSPVPQTEIFKNYKDKLSEPLLQNNSLFSFFSQDKIKKLWDIKNYVRKLNKSFSLAS